MKSLMPTVIALMVGIVAIFLCMTSASSRIDAERMIRACNTHKAQVGVFPKRLDSLFGAHYDVSPDRSFYTISYDKPRVVNATDASHVVYYSSLDQTWRTDRDGPDPACSILLARLVEEFHRTHEDRLIVEIGAVLASSLGPVVAISDARELLGIVGPTSRLRATSGRELKIVGASSGLLVARIEIVLRDVRSVIWQEQRQ